MRRFRGLGAASYRHHGPRLHHDRPDRCPARSAQVACDDTVFRETCRDVLRVGSIKITREDQSAGEAWLDEILAKHCPPRHQPPQGNKSHPAGSAVKTNGHCVAVH